MQTNWTAKPYSWETEKNQPYVIVSYVIALDPVTLILDIDLFIMKMYLTYQNEVLG